MYQDFSRQAQIVGKESYGERYEMHCCTVLVKFKNYQASTSLHGQLNQMETELINLS